MPVRIPKYQALFFRSLQERTINTGANLIVNGTFNTDLASWTADDYIWSAGTAAYQWTAGCYRGSINQVVNLVAGKRYKLTFKYKAISGFDIIIRFLDPGNVFIIPEQIVTAVTNGMWKVREVYINCLSNVSCRVVLGHRSTGSGDFAGSCHDSGNAQTGLYFDDVTMYEQTIQPFCSSCDEIMIDSSKPLDFQILKENIPALNADEDFEENPIAIDYHWQQTIFTWSAGKWCYSGGTDDGFLSYNEIALVAGKTYRFRFKYSKLNDDDDLNLTFSVKNFVSPFATAFTSTIHLTDATTSTEIEYEFTVPTNANYTLNFVLHPNAEAAANSVCFLQASLYDWSSLLIQSKDCAGNIATLPFSQVSHDSNVLVQINNNDFPANPFQIWITDEAGNVFYSEILVPLEIHNNNTCKILRQLVKLKWTNNCKFDELDYTNLPFENEIYLFGYIKDNGLDKLEREQYIYGDQLSRNVYNRSACKVELQLAAYSSSMIQTLNRLFEHNSVFLNDEEYVNDDSSVLTPNSLDNGKYTSRIDLIKVGSQLVTTNSCCQ